MPRYARSKCEGGTCVAASPQFECEYLGEGQCETYVMGGGDGGAFKTKTLDHAEFLLQRVTVCSKAMKRAGIEIGDTITHVDGQFFNDVDSFAAAVLDLRGKSLRFIRPDGSRAQVTLK